MNLRVALTALAALMSAGGTVAAQSRAPQFCAALQSIDTDRNGSIDIDEAKTAAAATFDRLNTAKDKEGGVIVKDLQGRLSKKEFAEAAHGGKKLSKDDYLAVIESRFRAADTDNSGTLDCKKIATKQGKAFERLMK